MNNNLDVLFLGGLFPKEKEVEIVNNSIGNIQNAANNLQWELVSGLNANLNDSVKIINSLFIGSFPQRYKKLNIETYKFSHMLGKEEAINVGFCNLVGIKQMHRYITLKPFIKEWAKENSEKKKVIIAYAMTATFTKLLKYVRTLDENIITCLIVPDLPQYMNLAKKQTSLYNIFKKVEIKQIYKDLQYVDCYVFLTKYMQDFLKIKAPSVVVEGIATDIFVNVESVSKEPGIKTILYSGGLEEKYGVINLIKSFERITEKNFRLIICGSGSSQNEVIEASKRDKRIIFKGLIAREEVLKLQKSSDVLINPRPNNEEYTKYSFPSKIMEYLSSGVPVISYKLDGIPEEYYDYMYMVNDEKDGLYKAMKEVLNKPEDELKKAGIRSKQFVMNNKSNIIQTKKILKLIDSVGVRKHNGKI